MSSLKLKSELPFLFLYLVFPLSYSPTISGAHPETRIVPWVLAAFLLIVFIMSRFTFFDSLALLPLFPLRFKPSCCACSSSKYSNFSFSIACCSYLDSQSTSLANAPKQQCHKSSCNVSSSAHALARWSILVIGLPCHLIFLAKHYFLMTSITIAFSSPSNRSLTREMISFNLSSFVSFCLLPIFIPNLQW